MPYQFTPEPPHMGVSSSRVHAHTHGFRSRPVPVDTALPKATYNNGLSGRSSGASPSPMAVMYLGAKELAGEAVESLPGDPGDDAVLALESLTCAADQPPTVALVGFDALAFARGEWQPLAREDSRTAPAILRGRWMTISVERDVRWTPG